MATITLTDEQMQILCFALHVAQEYYEEQATKARIEGGKALLRNSEIDVELMMQMSARLNKKVAEVKELAEMLWACGEVEVHEEE